VRHKPYNVVIVSVAAFSYYYEDPGGLIPSWIINWAAKVSTYFYLYMYFVLGFL